MEVVSDIRRDIRKSGRKYRIPNKSEKIIAPQSEIITEPEKDTISRNSRRCLGTWKAIELPQKTLLKIDIIETFAITRAISPLPSLPHIRVENTTRAKLVRRIINFEPIVNAAFFDNISF